MGQGGGLQYWLAELARYLEFLGSIPAIFKLLLREPVVTDVGTVAEWSKALLLRETNQNQNIPGLSPSLGNLSKKLLVTDSR